MSDWLSLFAVYRAVQIRGDEVVRGVLHPEYGPDHPEVRAGLAEWEGTHFLHQTARGTEVTLIRPAHPKAPERWWLHGLLAALTLLTTTLAGSYFTGHAPLRFVVAGPGSSGFPFPVQLLPGEVLPGLIFSVPLLVVLLGHELGHYLVAGRYGMNVSPPYFIPAPPWINVVGTFGAFIRIRSAMINRSMLMDVGAGGPVASFVLSIPAILVGLAWSTPVPAQVGSQARYVVIFGEQPIWLGGSLLFDWLASGSGGALLLHPLAFAGWLGLFVTAMNLFPLAQLDGGHILYALIGRLQRVVGLAFLALLVFLGREWWGWWLWAGMIVVLGRGSIAHPPVMDQEFPIGRRRAALGWACLVIFVLTFVTVPIHL